MTADDFDSIYGDYWNWCVNRARSSKWGRGQDVEALAQEGMLSLWKWLTKGGTLKDTGHLKAKLDSYMRSAARDEAGLRSKYRLEKHYLEEITYTDPATEPATDDFEIPEYVLTPFEMRIWQHVVVDGRSQQSLADDVGCDQKNISYHKQRAVAKVRDWYLNSCQFCTV